MKSWLILIIIVFGLLLLTLHAGQQSAVTLAEADEMLPVSDQRVPVLVELFTSEGCSSCPPADALLEKLERLQPVPGAEIIALSEHVDYWNYIGWSDPFSSALFSQRQQAYSLAFNRDGVYTPQMVVDGQAEFVGSNFTKAREAILEALTRSKATIEITQAAKAKSAVSDAAINTEKFNVQVRGLPVTNGERIQVMLAVTENNLASDVLRGENSGRKLSHVSVVRQLINIGEADGPGFTGAPEIRLANDWKREHLRIVIFAQEGHRRVLGAAAVRLKTLTMMRE